MIIKCIIIVDTAKPPREDIFILKHCPKCGITVNKALCPECHMPLTELSDRVPRIRKLAKRLKLKEHIPKTLSSAADNMIQDRRAGMSYKALSHKYGISKSTIRRKIIKLTGAS